VTVSPICGVDRAHMDRQTPRKTGRPELPTIDIAR
jgi:hypothetical protein